MIFTSNASYYLVKIFKIGLYEILFCPSHYHALNDISKFYVNIIEKKSFKLNQTDAFGSLCD